MRPNVLCAELHVSCSYYTMNRLNGNEKIELNRIIFMIEMRNEWVLFQLFQHYDIYLIFCLIQFHFEADGKYFNSMALYFRKYKNFAT